MEVEEGELETIPVRRSLRELIPDTSRRYENKAGSFITGIDVTSKEAIEKKEQRAKRFHFRAEVNLAQRNVALDRDVMKKAIPKVRLDTIYICGVDEMSTQDIFAYFKEYPPAHIEWLDDTSCNVVWLDEVTATRALINMSSLPDQEKSKSRENNKEKTAEKTKKEKQEESSDDETEEGEVEDDNPSDVELDALSQVEEDSLLRNDLRPANKLAKGNKLFMRFATKDDKKELGAARRSQYYMKYGNPNYGGMKGILSNSWKRRYHSRRIHRDVIKKRTLIGDDVGLTPPYKHRHSGLVNVPEEPIEEEEEEEEDPGGGELPLAAGAGCHSVPNEKIAIWLKDCRTPLGASLDEQSNPLLKGMLVRNGGSFEDDLSLGAEANQLRSDAQTETCNGVLAKDRRLQFHQKGRSMNSTGSGKSSATVSSVSELLELYEEDPEEVLYNLGFGRDEPDIASKIPARFFNSSSFARGIDIKVFLNAQIQRMEVENPSFALTSRFRQIEVLTTVANAFSSLYSQVSGTPLQKIGSMNSVSSSKEASSPPPLNRSNTASRLMKTLSKLNLCGTQQADGSSSSSPSPVEKGKSPAEVGSEENDVKSESKLPKYPKKKDCPSLLAPVKEEIAGSQTKAARAERPTHLPAVADGAQEGSVPPADGQGGRLASAQDRPCEEPGLLDSPGLSSSSSTSDSSVLTQRLCTASPARDPCAPLANPSVVNLMLQQKDSFEMEEIQSTEGDLPHVSATHQLAVTKSRKDQLLRTASQHSDSSGFAEDSTDCSPFNQLQVQESLQGMGSSADSCDSETTVTSHSEEQKTPIAKELPCFDKFEEEEEEDDEEEDYDDDEEDIISQAERRKSSDSRRSEDRKISDCKTEQSQGQESKSSHISETVQGEVSSKEEDISSEHKESDLLEEGSVFEFPQYHTHHILKSMQSLEGDGSTTSSVDRVQVALQRAEMRIINSPDSKARCTLLKSKDLLRKQRLWFAESGYPLRRSQSLPTALLNPVKVVSSVNVQLSPGKETLCSPPSFTYKYTRVEEDKEAASENDRSEEEAASGHPVCKSTLFIAPSSSKKEVPQAGPSRLSEDLSPTRVQSCPLHMPAAMSRSTCSLHSLPTEWQDQPLCEHMRTLSTHSIPSISGSSFSAMLSPFSCPFFPRHGVPHRPPAMNPPSTVEMQLRRVLHDIRNSLQNLSQYPVMRGQDFSAATGYTTQKSSILPLYENTFQELQVVRRNLNLFRTQMMDLELTMLRQQTTVYQHMTEEERFEADQLQSLRKSVRMELQELEMQLEERLLALEDQLRSLHMSSPYRPQAHIGMYGSRSADNLSCPSPLNVIEPVSELIREQSFLKSELGLGLGELGLETLPAEGAESVFSHGNSDSSSVCSGHTGRRAKSQSKKLYRASVALTPTPPLRAGAGQPVESSEELADSKPEVEHKLEKIPLMPSADEIHKAVEQEELQQVIREIKESIVGEIRREIVSGLLAAVSPQSRSATAKQDTQP